MTSLLEFEQEAAKRRIHELHSETLEHLTGDATIAERDTWTMKEIAARAFVAGTINQADTNMLATEAGMVGLTLEYLVAAIIGKADVYKFLVGKAAGLRKQALVAIDNCVTADEVVATVEGIEIQSDIEINEFIQATGM